MNRTPQGNRLHVGLFGEINAGKSALFNALTNTDISIVSNVAGTTTDSVQKAMELLPFGPIVLIDTAGLNDKTELGGKRLEKTKKVVNRVDLALYVIDAAEIPNALVLYKEFIEIFKSNNTPHMVVITKCDITVNPHHDDIFQAIPVSVYEQETIDELKHAIVRELTAISNEEMTILADFIKPGSTVVTVIPIDSAAPKKRLILPQVQLLRDCLDHNSMAYACTVQDLPKALDNLKRVDLVVTDSQVFDSVAEIVPKDVMLTSFSILMSRQRGNFEIMLNGIDAIKKLKDGDRVLISEVCTHSRSHEDIGTVKIPNALYKLGGTELQLEFTQGRDFPQDLSPYSLIVHCGGCMITAREMHRRTESAKEAGVPITNYGLFLAHATGILERSIEIFKGNGK